MGNFTAIDLSKLPAPKVIESLSYETIFQDILNDFLTKNPTYSTLLESDPAMILLQVCAYRELLLRNRINEAAKATMLAYAMESDLEHLASSLGVQKLIGESDDQLRQRVQLAPEAFTNAGSVGAYTFHALSASSDIKSVSVKSPAPGKVLVTILSKTGDGTASEELMGAVLKKLSFDDVRPLTDNVSVQSAKIIKYLVEAVITVYSGPSSAIVQKESLAALNKFLSERHTIGQVAALSGIYDALHVDGVKKVKLINPTSDVIATDEQAVYCNNINVSIVVDD